MSEIEKLPLGEIAKYLGEQVRELETERDHWRNKAAEVANVANEAQIKRDRLKAAWIVADNDRTQLREMLTAAESRLAQAQREAFEAGARWSRSLYTQGASPVPEAARRYPAVPEGGERHCGCWADRAPSEPCVCPRIGEQWAVRAWHCDTCKRGGTGSGLRGKQECNATRNAFPDHPTPTPERDRWVDVPVMVDDTRSDAWRVAPDLRLRITPEDARRIVSLAAQDGGSV